MHRKSLYQRYLDFRCRIGFHPIGYPGIKHRIALDDGMATYLCPRCGVTFKADLDLGR